MSCRATASSRTVESNARRDLPATAPVSTITWRTASKIRFGRSDRQPAPPVRQRARMEGASVDGDPTRRLPPQVERDRIRRPPDQTGRATFATRSPPRPRPAARRAATARGKQILEHLRRKQPLPMRRQEHEHAARLEDAQQPTPHPTAHADYPIDPAHRNHRQQSPNNPTATRIIQGIPRAHETRLDPPAFENAREAVIGVGRGDLIGRRQRVGMGVAHRDAVACPPQHRHVVGHVTERHDVRRPRCPAGGPAPRRRSPC